MRTRMPGGAGGTGGEPGAYLICEGRAEATRAAVGSRLCGVWGYASV